MCEQNGISIMTVNRGVLTYEPLECDAFFGRDAELAYLEDAVKSRRHVLVSGVGGIGKTELLRQLIRVVSDNGIIDELWMVPWNGSIKQSFADSYIDAGRKSIDDRFEDIVSCLRFKKDVRRLILIDNVEDDIRDDAMLDIISSLADAIVVSSRTSAIEGFENLALGSLSNESCAKVFEYAYGRRLHEDEMSLVESSIESVFMRHTLSIGIIGRYMRRHHEPVSNLNKLGSELNAFTLPQMYRSMYHVFGMSDDERKLMAFLARCPRESYRLSFLMEYYTLFSRSVKAFLKTVEDLADGGWLNLNADEVSVQPYIAENIVKVTSCPAEAEMFIKMVLYKWTGEKPTDGRMPIYAEELEKSANTTDLLLRDIVSSFCEKYLETLSEECFMAYVLSRYISIYEGYARTDAALDYIYLKAEKIGYFTNILMKLKSEIRSGEQFEELDNEIKAGENQMSEENRIILSNHYINLCMLNNSYERLPYYFNYLFEHAKDERSRCNAGTAKLQYYVYIEDVETAIAYIGELKTWKVSEENRFNILYVICNCYYVFGQYQALYDSAKELSEAYSHKRGDIEISCKELMSIALSSIGRYEEAEKYFVETLKYLETIEELRNKITVSKYRQDYATLLERMGRFDEAETVYKDCIRCVEGIISEQQVNIMKNNLAVLYIRMERGKDALEILDALHTVAVETVGKETVFYMETLNNHSKACELVGDLGRARTETEECYPLLCKIYGAEHRKSVEAKERLERLRTR